MGWAGALMLVRYVHRVQGQNLRSFILEAQYNKRGHHKPQWTEIPVMLTAMHVTLSRRPRQPERIQHCCVLYSLLGKHDRRHCSALEQYSTAQPRAPKGAVAQLPR